MGSEVESPPLGTALGACGHEALCIFVRDVLPECAHEGGAPCRTDCSAGAPEWLAAMERSARWGQPEEEVVWTAEGPFDSSGPRGRPERGSETDPGGVWHRVGSLFCWHGARSSTKLVLHLYCTRSALGPPRYCIGASSVLVSCMLCASTALVPWWHYVGVALVLHPYLLGTWYCYETIKARVLDLD